MTTLHGSAIGVVVTILAVSMLKLHLCEGLVRHSWNDGLCHKFKVFVNLGAFDELWLTVCGCEGRSCSGKLGVWWVAFSLLERCLFYNIRSSDHISETKSN